MSVSVLSWAWVRRRTRKKRSTLSRSPRTSLAEQARTGVVQRLFRHRQAGADTHRPAGESLWTWAREGPASQNAPGESTIESCGRSVHGWAVEWAASASPYLEIICYTRNASAPLLILT